MSIEFSTASKWARWDISATAIDRDTNWTIAFWFKRTTDGGSFQGLAAPSANASTRTSCVEFYVNEGDDNAYAEINSSGGGEVMIATTTDVWYYLAYTRVASGGAITLWHGTDGTASVSSSTSAYTTLGGLNNYLTLGALANQTFGLIGRIAHCRMWTSVLNQTQLEAEMVSPTAVISSGLLVAIEGTDSGDLDLDSGPSGFTATLSASAPTYSTDAPSIVTSGTSVAPLAMGAYSRMRNG